MKAFRLYLGLLASACTAAALAQPAPYACGGVGLDEQQRMKDEARNRDLMLTFATTTGSYVADVAVRIRDSRGGTVIDANCDGPIMLVDLPAAGRYRVTARYGDLVREQAVTVSRGKRPTRATFVWPAEKG